MAPPYRRDAPCAQLQGSPLSVPSNARGSAASLPARGLRNNFVTLVTGIIPLTQGGRHSRLGRWLAGASLTNFLTTSARRSRRRWSCWRAGVGYPPRARGLPLLWALRRGWNCGGAIPTGQRSHVPPAALMSGYWARSLDLVPIRGGQHLPGTGTGRTRSYSSGASLAETRRFSTCCLCSSRRSPGRASFESHHPAKRGGGRKATTQNGADSRVGCDR